VAYTDYQQRALYGAGQSAQRAGQRFHMEREALEDGDIDAAKYHRARANALNRQGAYAAVRGMGGDQGANQYFGVDSSGQPIRTAEGVALSSAGRDIFDRFRDTGFVEPIRQKKRYAPNTEPRGLDFLMDKIASNTMMAKMASKILPKKEPEPDDAYYKSLWGKGLNEMYSPSGIFRSGKFLGDADIDPYYERPYTGPKWAERYLKPFVQPRFDAFGVVRDSSIPEDWEFMQETPMDYAPYPLFREDETDIVTNLVEGETEDDLTENFAADEKEEIPFEFNLSELLENIASIPVNPDKAMQHGFEGSATELWTKAKEQAKQAGLDLSGKEVLEMLFRDGWFNPDKSIAVGDM